MKVTVVCSDPAHPAWPHLRAWRPTAFRPMLLTTPHHAPASDFMFLVSCTHLVHAAERQRHKHVLVLHESALPNGRGWSPLAWQVLYGHNIIPVTLFEAVDAVDAGNIWHTDTIELDGTELADEISKKAVQVKCRMMEWAVSHPDTHAIPQRHPLASDREWPRRWPDHSRLDPHETIVEQFNLLRICEPRFPAFFEYRGCRYEVTLRKAN